VLVEAGCRIDSQSGVQTEVDLKQRESNEEKYRYIPVKAMGKVP
jgi:hypothetical protein